MEEKTNRKRKISRDKSHYEQIERWAKFVRENPDNWKKEFNQFIDSQYALANRFYKHLLKTKKGREKLKELGRLR